MTYSHEAIDLNAEAMLARLTAVEDTATEGITDLADRHEQRDRVSAHLIGALAYWLARKPEDVTEWHAIMDRLDAAAKAGRL
jgi:hypothetical protein